MVIKSQPTHTPEAADEARDLAACKQLLANGSRTFLAASKLLPGAVRDPACALYAFCRLADDEVDGQTGGGAPRAAGDAAAGQAVGRLRQRLAEIYAGRPGPQAADRALAVVVRRFDIPAELPQALIEGFEWDAAGRRYDSLHELQAYAARVAGAVGAMMALLMGVRSAAGLARACDLGVAMQLSNIARDVGEDARLGRLYLPRQWLHEAGICPDAWLAAPRHSPALGAVVQRLLREADALYARVDAGVAALPLGCRPGINAARFLYAQIGLEVERQGLNAVDRRAVVSRRRKATSLLRALLTLLPDDSWRPQPPLPATRYLVEAVTGPLHAGHFVAPAPRRLAGVVALFDRLERRDRGWTLADGNAMAGGAE
ncbi:MAG: phytoene/squalene synthase family protein [Pseudomonadota bacterium]